MCWGWGAGGSVCDGGKSSGVVEGVGVAWEGEAGWGLGDHRAVCS